MAWNQLFAKKSLDVLLAEAEGGHRLRRALGPVTLTALGIGAIIGTGIFVLIGKAALTAGPSLIVSFMVAGLACVFAALCYAEFASMAPVAGSAYTYAYATLGELMAWIIGWDLILEYAVASSAVAHGWSKYFQSLLDQFSIHLPHIIADAPFDFVNGKFAVTGAVLDLPAVCIALIITGILVIGIKESAAFNAVMVAIKVGVVFLVIGLGAFFIDPGNWQPFAPNGFGGLSLFGSVIWGQADAAGPVGMMAGAAIIFFAYLGFDAVSTQAEEARNPKRDIPIGIIGSLVICTILYICVAAVLTGMVNSAEIIEESHIGTPRAKDFLNAPVAYAFRDLTWIRLLVTLGALTGMTSVLLVMMLGQPRILLAMARDGLLPPGVFAAIHPRFRTPWKSTLLTGAVVATASSLLPLNVLADLTNIGTLFAFILVCSAVLVMRKIDPGAERPFRVPFSPTVPLIGIALCLLLMLSLPEENWLRLFIWLAVGFCIYFTYGLRHSKLRGSLAMPNSEGSNVAVSTAAKDTAS
jgi:APA family basic amino acid/polyamine antiporter